MVENGVSHPRHCFIGGCQYGVLISRPSSLDTHLRRNGELLGLKVVERFLQFLYDPGDLLSAGCVALQVATQSLLVACDLGSGFLQLLEELLQSVLLLLGKAQQESFVLRKCFLDVAGHGIRVMDPFRLGGWMREVSQALAVAFAPTECSP